VDESSSSRGGFLPRFRALGRFDCLVGVGSVLPLVFVVSLGDSAVNR